MLMIEQAETEIAEARRVLDGALSGVLAAFSQTLAQLDGLPSTEVELGELLDRLAATELDCRGHFDRFADEAKAVWNDQPGACRDDWHRCCSARTEVVDEIVRFAVARRKPA